MANNQTVELEIRAQDFTGKTINDVRKNVRDLKKDMAEQAKAASKGKADFKAYEQGLKELADAANRLSNISAVASKLEKLGADVASSADKAKQSGKAFDELNQKIGALGVPTQKQIEQLGKLANAHKAAQEKARKAADAYERQRIEAEQYGINTRNLKQSQDALQKTYERTLKSIIDLRNAQRQLQQQNQLATRINDAKAAAERKQLDANNAALRRNLELWRQQREAIAAAKAAMAQQKADALRQQLDANNAALRRNLELWRQQREAIAAAKAAMAQVQNDALRRQMDANNETLRRNIKLWQEQKAAIQAAKQAAQQQQALQQQRREINSQRVSITSQRRQAQAEANRNAPRNQNAVNNAINPSMGMRDIAGSVRGAQSALRNQAASADTLTAALKRLREAQRQMLATAKNIDAYQRQRTALQQTITAYRQTQAEYSRLNNAMRNGATQQQVQQLAQLQQRLHSLGAAYAQQSVQLNQSRAALNAAGVSTNNLSQAESRLAANAQRSAAAMAQLEQRVRATAASQERSGNASRNALGYFQRLRGQVIALTSAYVGLQGAIALFKKTIEASQEGKVLKIRTEVLADGWDTTAEDLEQYFRGTAERMGLVLTDVIQDASKLFVSGKEGGFDLQTSKYIYEQFAGLGQLMGADATAQKGITKAISQMLSKSTIQAEELKQQLGDHLPQAMALFSKAMGVSNEELMKMMKDGKVLSSDVLPKVADVIKNQYGAAMEKMYDTIPANQARLNNSFKDWLRLIADAGVADNFKQLLKEIAQFFRDEQGKQWAANIATAMNAVINALRWAVKHADLLAKAFGALLAIGAIQALMAFGGALAGAASGIGALAAKTALFASRLQAGVSIVGGLRAGLAGLFTIGKNLFSIFTKFMLVFRIFQLIKAVFDGIVKGFDAARGTVDGATESLVGFSDVLFLVKEGFILFQELLEAVFAFVTELVAAATYSLVTFFGGMEDGVQNSEDTMTKAFRTIAKGMDALRWVARSVSRYIAQCFEWASAKINGNNYEMKSFATIAEEVAKEVSESGSEARFNKLLEERKKEREARGKNKPYVAEATTSAGAGVGSKTKEQTEEQRQKANERVEKAKQKAEEARQKAEEAALKRLNKQLSFEKLLEQRVRIWKGLEKETLTGSQNLVDYQMAQYEAVKRQYAAPKDPFGGVSESDTLQNEAADKQLQAADMQIQAASGSKGTTKQPAGAAGYKYAQSSLGLAGAAPNKGSRGVTAPTGAVGNRIDTVISTSHYLSGQAYNKNTHQIMQGVKKMVTQSASACAKYVNESFRKAGFKMQGHGADVARNAINSGQGFQEVQYSASYVPQKGDIMSIPRGLGQSKDYGHVAVFDGKQWVSDYVQRIRGNTAATNDVSMRNIQSGRAKVTIARYTGKNGGIIQTAGGAPYQAPAQQYPGGGSTGNQPDSKGMTARDRGQVNYWKAQEKRWKAMNKQGKYDGQWDEYKENAEQNQKQFLDLANDKLKDFFATTGIGSLEDLSKIDPKNMRLDLSNASLDMILRGIKDINQVSIDKETDNMAAAVIELYRNTKKADGSLPTAAEATAYGENIKPAIAQYNKLQVEKAFQDVADKVVDAVTAERSRWEKERQDKTEIVAEKVSRGEITPEQAAQEIAEIHKETDQRLQETINKLNELINSQGFAQLSASQQASIKNQREQLVSEQKNPALSGGQQSADAVLNAQAAKVQAVLKQKRDFEANEWAKVNAGLQSIVQAEDRINAYNQKNTASLVAMRDEAVKLMQAFDGMASPEALTKLIDATKDLGRETGKTALQVQFQGTLYDQLNTGAMTAFDSIAKGIAGVITGNMSWRESLAMVGQAMAQWAAETLMALAKVIVQYYITYALQQALGMGTGTLSLGGIPNAGGSGVAGVFHTGGIVGGGKQVNRTISSLVFASATRYHSGGIAGLMPNEVPAVLQKGEEVLTKQDPRHRDNGGLGGRNGQPLTVINSFDPKQAMKDALSSAAGRRILVNAAGRERKAFGRLS